MKQRDFSSQFKSGRQKGRPA